MSEPLAAPHAHHLRTARTARYYTLGGEAGVGGRASVWFVLHGYGQLAGEFIRYFADLAAPDRLIVAPEAMNRFYLVGVDKAPAHERPVGATWMTREDRASEIADYVEYLDAVYEDTAGSAAGDPVRVSVVGFSQGAATATRWITHGRSRIDRLILWGGLVPPDADLAKGHGALRHVPLTIVVGERDAYVTSEMLAEETARLEAARIPFELIRFAGGHAVSRTVFSKLTGERAD
ncbi:MAG TPA: dienelactone hydrolase family protein [Gemmatimonadaceae bacterium]|nr:dienelactone hydrolase family protein [Gemmatimonadaceae bacterium]